MDYYDIHVYRSQIKTIIAFDLILKIFRRRVLQGETCSFHITRLRPLGTHIRLQGQLNEECSMNHNMTILHIYRVTSGPVRITEYPDPQLYEVKH